MTSAGSPEIQNWIPMEHLGTGPLAAWQASLVVAVCMALFGYWWLTRMLKRAVARGEVAISSGALDSLPHNGYVVTTIRAICNETHAAAYPALGALTVIVPLLGLTLCLFLFAFGM